MTSHIVMHDPFRPKKLSISDRAVFITQDSEVMFRAITANGDIHLMARCEIAQNTTQKKWQLRRIIYDQDGQVTAIKWPLNDQGIPSRDYRFIWKEPTLLQITDVSLTNPCVITADNSLSEGDLVYLTDIKGPGDLNFTGNNLYTVTNPTPQTFELKGIDSSDMTAYKSGGQVNYYYALQSTFA